MTRTANRRTLRNAKVGRLLGNARVPAKQKNPSKNSVKKTAAQREARRLRARRTAKSARKQTAKRRELPRSQTAKRRQTKPLKLGRLLANVNVPEKSGKKSGEKTGEIRWSRPSPRSGVRLPLGAHPWNTGGKRGRSGPKRAMSDVFGLEYFSQPLRETLQENSEENNDAMATLGGNSDETSDRTSEHTAIKGISKIDENRNGRSVLDEAQSQVSIPVFSPFARATRPSWANPRLDAPTTRFPGVLTDWDPLESA